MHSAVNDMNRGQIKNGKGSSGPMLLLYNLGGSCGDPWRAAARRLGIAVRAVQPSEYDQPIGALLTSASKAGSGFALGFAEAMIVFAHLPEGMLDVCLETAYSAGADRGVLKAVLTPSNVNWSSKALREELLREQESFSRCRATNGGESACQPD